MTHINPPKNFKLLLAKLFGRKTVEHDDGPFRTMEITSYHFRGVTYVTMIREV